MRQENGDCGVKAAAGMGKTMEQYSVLLVDDEEEVTQVILQKIDWESLGFHIIGSATNGVKALEMAEKYQPDVVMTDIKMPYMDGLELSGRLKKEFPTIRILLFTGFDEFEYAKEAVHLEVEEYILKPINSTELTEVFVRLKETLDQDREEKRSVEKLQNYYLESLPLLQANFYSSLIEGRVSETDLSKYLSDYRIELEGPVYCCAAFHTSAHHVPENMSPLLLAMSVQRQVQEHLGEKWKARFFTYLGNTVMIAQMKTEAEVPELTDECDRFCKWALRILDAEVTAGIGRAFTELLKLDQSYSGAREAVSYRVLYGTGRAINIGEIAPKEASGFEPNDDTNLRKLYKNIHLGEKAAIAQSVEEYIKELSVTATSVQQYKVAVMELAGSIYRFASGNYIDLEKLCGSGENLYEMVPQMDIRMLKKWMTEQAFSFADILSSARSNASKTYVSEARNYVRDNYDDADLSLDKICSSLGVSSSYFSSIFKKETGESFVGYLTNYRMEQAAKLILESDAKNYVIARKVGYEDANYFSYVFKKAYGMSPSKYRTEHTAQ